MLKFYLKFEVMYFATMRTECVIVLSFLNLRKYNNCADVLFSLTYRQDSFHIIYFVVTLGKQLAEILDECLVL